MATTTNTTSSAASGRNVASELAYLTRALKAPSLASAVERLVERARAEGWTHEEFLAACLQREVAAREAHGGEDRIRAARFPSRKSLENFDFDHQRSLKRERISHLLGQISHGPRRVTVRPELTRLRRSAGTTVLRNAPASADAPNPNAPLAAIHDRLRAFRGPVGPSPWGGGAWFAAAVMRLRAAVKARCQGRPLAAVAAGDRAATLDSETDRAHP
jgi:IstB-like ATP binding protein